MDGEHFFSWPRSVEGLDRRALCRLGLRMVAAAPVGMILLSIVTSLLSAIFGRWLGWVVALLWLGGFLVAAAYFLRGIWLLLRSSFGAEMPRVAMAPAMAGATAPSSSSATSTPSSPPGQSDMHAPGAGAAWVLLLLGAMLGGLLWFNHEFDKYGKRARLSEGPLAASSLRMRIAETHERAGPADMSCNATHCNLVDVELPVGRHARSGVKQVSSDRTGAITIEYDFSFLPPGQRVLALAPMVEGRVVDLSSLRADRGGAGTLVWTCLPAKTTVPHQWLQGGRCG